MAADERRRGNREWDSERAGEGPRGRALLAGGRAEQGGPASGRARSGASRGAVATGTGEEEEVFAIRSLAFLKSSRIGPRAVTKRSFLL